MGHIQATGLDEAGRKQYLYHERWHLRAAQRKFESMREFAAALPRLRRAVKVDLTPAVCRSSYIDPRVLDRFRDGETIELPRVTAEGADTSRRRALLEPRVLALIE